MNYLISTRDVSKLLNETELLFKDLFDRDSFFNSIFTVNNINYPVNIRENDSNLEIEVAVVGIDKDDIKIDIDEESRILTVSYTKPEEKNVKQPNYIYKGITQKSFSHAWKIGAKFDLEKCQANLDKGLLKLVVPALPEKKSKQINVKIA